MQNTYLRWLAYAGLSIIIAPIIVFNAGLLLVGEYEGEGGVAGFMGDIYGSALLGQLSAWVILLGPVLLALIWLGVRRTYLALPGAATTGSD